MVLLKKYQGGKMKKPIAVIDLYCGMGGFTQGAVEAGATVILSCDFWDEAVKVHKLNHPGIPCLQLKLGSASDWKLIKQYIDKYPNHHIHLHGSPPCQALSNASSTDPSKGMPLILHLLDLVDKLNPDSWSMENVVPMRKRLPEGTPSVILNSADYGVPQTRRRCIAGEGWLANPSHSKEEWVSVIEALPHLENELPTLRLIKLEALGSNSKRSQDRTILEPSKTICGSGNQVGARIFNHEEKPIKIRSLTIEETLILQGFNPNFDLSIVKTQKSRWTLIGNVVCPPVAKAIIEGIQ